MVATHRVIGRNDGFTLIEVLLVAFMLALVLTSVYSLYSANQRTATMEDEVVDVQQNLRIAVDTLTRDIRHAGFLISHKRDNSLFTQGLIAALAVGNGNIVQPVNAILDNSANSAARLPFTDDVIPGQPARVHADILTMNFASPFTTFAKIANEQTGIGAPFIVLTSESVDTFFVNDKVRIINPTRHEQSTNLSPTETLGGQGTVFRITALDRALRSITLVWDSPGTDNDPAATKFKRGDIIAKVSTVNMNYPNSIAYCLGPAVNCGPAITSCPQQGPTDQTLCLVRIENGQANVVASRISGLQFTYLLDDGTEVTAPADLGAIRAIRVALTGRTATASRLVSATTGTEKTRKMATVVRLQNRLIAK
jgi:prepilin-type N-terminal cleavage/methylation domain-containing protein